MERSPADKRQFIRLRGNTVEVFGRTVPLPKWRPARVGLGILFIIGGIFSFLPVLGIWMLPLGLLILSIDFVIVRRWRRRLSVQWGRRHRRREEHALRAAMPSSKGLNLARRRTKVHHHNG